MKKLQNNFTTPQQSKRLLGMGFPADSADCYWNDISLKPIPMQEGILYSDKRNQFTEVNVPVWSVGRLMEIAHICSDSTLSYKEEANEIQKFKEEQKCETLIEAVIMCIEDAVSIGGMDFSKLEE